MLDTLAFIERAPVILTFFARPEAERTLKWIDSFRTRRADADAAVKARYRALYPPVRTELDRVLDNWLTGEAT
jgi:hypothetical protein